MATEKRLIDAIALISKAQRMETADNNGIPVDTYAVSVLAIENAPTVDAVEVVRCKDCKHYHTHNRSVRFDCKELYCCRSALKKVGPDDFCSYGERKDNG